MICIGIEVDTFPPRPIVPPPVLGIGTKKARGGLGMTVEKRDKRIMVYLIESEYQAVTRAAGFRGRPPWWPLIGLTPKWRGHTRSAARVSPGRRIAATAARRSR